MTKPLAHWHLCAPNPPKEPPHPIYAYGNEPLVKLLDHNYDHNYDDGATALKNSNVWPDIKASDYTHIPSINTINIGAESTQYVSPATPTLEGCSQYNKSQQQPQQWTHFMRRQHQNAKRFQPVLVLDGTRK